MPARARAAARGEPQAAPREGGPREPARAWRRSPPAISASPRPRRESCVVVETHAAAPRRRAPGQRQARRAPARDGTHGTRGPRSPPRWAPADRRPRERMIRLRLMLLALSISPLGARDRRRASSHAAGARPRLLRAARPRGRASARSTSTRAAAPSSTGTAGPSRCRWTRRASTRCPRTSRTRPRTAAALAQRPRARRRRAQGPAGPAPEEPRLRLGAAQGRPRGPRRAVRDAAARRHRLPHREPPLLPASASWPRRCSATWASTTRA